MRFQKLAIGAAVIATIGAVSACGSGSESSSAETSSGTSDSQTLTTFTMSYADTANSAQLALGLRKGIFKKHGIDLKREGSGGKSGASHVAQLLNGQIQASFTEVTAVPAAVSKNIGVTVIASLAADYESPNGNAFATLVSADSDIHSFKDLEDKTVAVNSLNSMWSLAVQEAVRKDGGDPAKMKILAIGLPDQVPALKQGRVDAVATLQPFVGQLQSGGYRVLGDQAAIALGPQSVGSVMMASKAYVKKNPKVMTHFLEAWAEATDYANAHPDEVRQVIVETTHAPEATVAKLPLPWYVNGVSRESVVGYMDLMVRYGLLKKTLPIDDVVWPEAPNATNLMTPPPGLTVSSS